MLEAASRRSVDGTGDGGTDVQVRGRLPAPPLRPAVYAPAAAPPPRTLLRIFLATVRTCPDSLALDDGTEALTYRAAWQRVVALREVLRRAGVGAGDRVGVRMPSGTVELYLAILAVLASGAAYVPVDHDDPVERADKVWREAGVRGVFGPGARFEPPPCAVGGESERQPPREPNPADDAWIIFTSGSTGVPKGVAITHRAAAAFVDAESALFLAHRPLGPADRVLAGLSVAFDASCEEMWLAWRHGACLVPAPRSLVRAGAELGPWLSERRITVVSTVPTLAALWPSASLRQVRLLILGGEACPKELARRLTAPDREVWNTYGPTETTVVASAARIDRGGPVRIGLPLPGWWLAVLDPAGSPVAWGETGELVIGGVGTGRYLDPAKDREKYRAVPRLGWPRAYFSGDLVRADPEGLVFLGRDDDQVKLSGRRVELGEVDAALLTLPGVAAGAAAVRTTAAGGDLLVGYIVPRTGAELDIPVARALLRTRLSAGLVPHLVTVEDIPVRTSGKVDRAALPWPCPGRSAGRPEAGDTGWADPAGGAVGWLADVWQELLGVPVEHDHNFFDLGGTSLATAQLVARLRERYPDASVADVYQYPRLTELAGRLDEFDGDRTSTRPVHRTPAFTGPIQALVVAALFAVTGFQWLLGLAFSRTVLDLLLGAPVAGPTVPWGYLVAGWLVLLSSPGRLVLAGLGIRWLTRGVRPGCYPRGGSVHLRVWTAERLTAKFGTGSLTGTPLASWYARLLGCRVGRDVDLRADPPVTGLAVFGDGCAIEPEVDLAGWWLDGDMLHVGEVHVGAGARLGARSTLMPGASVGARSEIEPGSSVYGSVTSGESWGGTPARRLGPCDGSWPAPTRRSHAWNSVYSLSAFATSLLPLVAALPGLALWGCLTPAGQHLRLASTLLVSPLAGLASLLCYALLTAAVMRVAGGWLRTGVHPTGSRAGWAAWLVERSASTSRSILYPLYASLATPAWFRLLGAKVGRRAEISTTSGLPALMRVGDGAFLADDTLMAPYELRGGWLRTGPSSVGQRGFAGNSAIVGPDRAVSDGGLVAVLGSTPPDMPKNSSWVGRPPIDLPRPVDTTDPTRTFSPPSRLVLARSCVELLRLLPWAMSAVLATLVLVVIDQVQMSAGWWACTVLAGPVLIAAGCVALLITTAIKWLLVGAFSPSEHPLWSSFVWRNELFDTFYEVLGMTWMGSALVGTPMMNAWLRTLGARIGRGVWCDSHWLPEPDLVHLGDAATVNRGCVLQTHLFHDRIMRTDAVRLEPGATLGPHSILLPGATVGAGATIGSTSLVMRGETVPPESRWVGNPIAAWPEEHLYPDRPTGRGRHGAVPPANPIAGGTSRGGIALAAAVSAIAVAGLAGPLVSLPAIGSTAISINASAAPPETSLPQAAHRQHRPRSSAWTAPGLADHPPSARTPTRRPHHRSPVLVADPTRFGSPTVKPRR